MTTPPLPDVPCLRVRLSGTDTAGNTWGTRFYLSYAGSAPTGANCVTLAGDIEAAFASDLASLMGAAYTLTEVDVLDIATDSGLSGQWTGTETGTRSGSNFPAQVCTNGTCGTNCAAGDLVCMNMCTPVSNTNCGACGVVCKTGERCTLGVCQTFDASAD